MAILEAETRTLKLKLEFSQLIGIEIATASNPKELGKAIRNLTNFVLQLPVPARGIFGCSAADMRQNLCDTMRRKRSLFTHVNKNQQMAWAHSEASDSGQPIWPRELAKSVGVLLRVFNTICDEENLDSEPPQIQVSR